MGGRVRQAWRQAGKDDRGTAAMEYALIGTLIAVVIIAALTTIGTDVVAMFDKVVDKLP